MVLRIKPRTELMSSGAVTVSDVADLYCDAKHRRAQSLPVPIPREDGIWLVDAGSILAAIYREYPGEKITVQGETIGWVTRRPDRLMKRGLFDRILEFVSGIMLTGSQTYSTKSVREAVQTKGEGRKRRI
jgi:hypothetical protein